MIYEIELNDVASGALEIDLTVRVMADKNSDGVVERFEIVDLKGKVWFGDYALDLMTTDVKAEAEARQWLRDVCEDEIMVDIQDQIKRDQDIRKSGETDN